MAGRPFVFLNMAMTADGKIASAAREYPHFTSDHDRRTMDELRAEADAVLIGAGTLRADNPRLGVRDPEVRAYRQRLGKPAKLTTIVVSRDLGLDPAAPFFRSDEASERIVATVEAASADRQRALAPHATIWRLGQEHVDLQSLLSRLRDRGIERLLVEGGAELNWSFVEADLFDELYITVAPALLGGREAPTIVGGPGLGQAARRRLRLIAARREGDEVFLHYAVERPSHP